MSGEAEKRHKELEVTLTLSFQFTQRLGAWVIHCLPNWGCFSTGKGEPVLSTTLQNNQESIRLTGRRGRREKTIFPKAIFYLRTAAGDGKGMVRKWDRRDREGWLAGTDEWMKHYVWQTLWHSSWKNRHVHVRDPKAAGRTSHLSSLIHIQWMLGDSGAGNISQQWQVSA